MHHLEPRCAKSHSHFSLNCNIIICSFQLCCLQSCQEVFSFFLSFSSTWGECLFITIQVVILLSLMFYYNRQTTYAVAFPPLFALAAWFLASGILTLDALTYCQGTVLPIMLLSRVSVFVDGFPLYPLSLHFLHSSISPPPPPKQLSQIITTYKNRTTGQLSFITAAMNAMGTGARVFTTLNEVQSKLLLVQSLAMFTVNSFIILQFYLYWNASPSKVKKIK